MLLSATLSSCSWKSYSRESIHPFPLEFSSHRIVSMELAVDCQCFWMFFQIWILIFHATSSEPMVLLVGIGFVTKVPADHRLHAGHNDLRWRCSRLGFI
mmetsp:Transcript_49435/g.124275  ORF Transcript_49435/g.124275 Transcript_49435/m.124275 type:complete len:99 (-) Transcript_49435:479-775(-)